MPGEEAHSFINDLQRRFASHLYGRRLYEVMLAWETIDPAGLPPHMADFAQTWRAADKVVYSTTLTSASSARTRIERDFDPAAVRRMKAKASGDLLVGGPELASHALQAGLVDECHLFLAPVVVGEGKPAFRRDLRLELQLAEERRFRDGMVYLRYVNRSTEGRGSP